MKLKLKTKIGTHFATCMLLICFITPIRAQEAQVADEKELARILQTLASDEMRGRPALSKDIEKAADFIASEFKSIGLKPYAEENYRQTFYINKVSIDKQQVITNNKNIATDQFLIYGSHRAIKWSPTSAPKILYIAKGDDFSEKFRSYVRQDQDHAIVLVDPTFQPMLARFKNMISKETIIPKDQAIDGPTKAFIIAQTLPTDYLIESTSKIEEFPLFNVAAVLPGKSKPNEYVIFSAHYDHIGILPAVGKDSIANGADDDASGTTAVMALAKYYKQLNQNERTLIFVAFTAEEVGMFGSKYFSNNINADDVVAMINIEMIGKDSKFGPNSLYITGYENSNLGKLMQDNLKGSVFKFHPDPYPQQNLFYRSDNAVLAALGVPAHTFSTSQIDKDELYHSVKDEVSTLKINNIKSSIEAIAVGAKGIIDGSQTPTRVEKLKD